MKIYSYCLIFLSAILFTSCDKETEDLSRSTYYVAFHLEGENPMLVPVGEGFSDPGVVATENGEDVTSTITIESDVNPDVMGLYTVEYTATNSDGLKSRAVREVFVCNPSVTTDISGTYTAQTGTHRISASSGARTDYSGYPVSITKVAPGFFYVTDFLAGYYDKRANYGLRYAMTGYFALNEDNTLDLVSSNVLGWGDGLDALNNGSYDPATGQVTWSAVYATTLTFNVILNQ